MTAEEAAMIMMSGGGRSSANIEPLTVTENGIYTASGDVDGYKPIIANVPEESTVTSSDTGISSIFCDWMDNHEAKVTVPFFEDYKAKICYADDEMLNFVEYELTRSNDDNYSGYYFEERRIERITAGVESYIFAGIYYGDTLLWTYNSPFFASNSGNYTALYTSSDTRPLISEVESYADYESYATAKREYSPILWTSGRRIYSPYNCTLYVTNNYGFSLYSKNDSGNFQYSSNKRSKKSFRVQLNDPTSIYFTRLTDDEIDLAFEQIAEDCNEYWTSNGYTGDSYTENFSV